MTYRFLLIVVCSFLSLNVFSQEETGHKISVKVRDINSDYLTIGYHLGNKQYIKDTIYIDSNGIAVLSGEERLDQGLYIVLLPDNRYFDVIIDNDQYFSIECSASDITASLHASGSTENENFIRYQKDWVSLQYKARELRTKLDMLENQPDSISLIRKEILSHEKTMLQFLKGTVRQYEGSFLAGLVAAMIPPERPEFNIPSDCTNPDSLKWIMNYNYNRDHYLDNIDLSDPRFIRTPVIQSRLKGYFSNILIQHPDSLIRAIPTVVDMSGGDSLMFRYIVVTLFNHFRESPVMGHDAVTLSIIDKYYLSGKAYWISEETYREMSDDAARIRPNIIGRKAVNLVLETYTGMHRSIYDIDKEFTILYFWEPNCGHCKTSTPLLKSLYDKYRNKDIEVFAVCTQDNREEWEKYIAEHELEWINAWDPDRQSHFDFYYNVIATPLVYVLDRDKKIIAKKIAVEDIEVFIDNFRKYGR